MKKPFRALLRRRICQSTLGHNFPRNVGGLLRRERLSALEASSLKRPPVEAGFEPWRQMCNKYVLDIRSDNTEYHFELN